LNGYAHDYSYIKHIKLSQHTFLTEGSSESSPTFTEQTVHSGYTATTVSTWTLLTYGWICNTRSILETKLYNLK